MRGLSLKVEFHLIFFVENVRLVIILYPPTPIIKAKELRGKYAYNMPYGNDIDLSLDELLHTDKITQDDVNANILMDCKDIDGIYSYNNPYGTEVILTLKTLLQTEKLQPIQPYNYKGVDGLPTQAGEEEYQIKVENYAISVPFKTYTFNEEGIVMPFSIQENSFYPYPKRTNGTLIFHNKSFYDSEHKYDYHQSNAYYDCLKYYTNSNLVFLDQYYSNQSNESLVLTNWGLEQSFSKNTCIFTSNWSADAGAYFYSGFRTYILPNRSVYYFNNATGSSIKAAQKMIAIYGVCYIPYGTHKAHGILTYDGRNEAINNLMQIFKLTYQPTVTVLIYNSNGGQTAYEFDN